jgi:hypothetical protein
VRRGRACRAGTGAPPATLAVSVLTALAPAALVLALAALALAPVALGAEVHAEEGGVAATLTYREGTGAALGYSGLHLTISRSGTSYYEAPVSSHYCATMCEPEQIGRGPDTTSPLAVADLEGDGVPSVMLELSTGGAHCCGVVQVFGYDPGVMAYRPIEHDFGDPGALLTDLAGNGELELESADDRFAYAFGPFVNSGLPLQVWEIREARFVNVTREFPHQIAANAAQQWHGFVAARREGLGNGLIAAWAADEELLGHRALVLSTLAREARRGNLRNRERSAPSGGAFVTALMRFLKRTGYG